MVPQLIPYSHVVHLMRVVSSPTHIKVSLCDERRDGERHDEEPYTDVRHSKVHNQHVGRHVQDHNTSHRYQNL